MSKAYLDNLKGLDILRFLLSIAVIAWHYQHFFYQFVPYEHNELFLQCQPFFQLLKLFYTNGYYAVHIFWMISGIIFIKVYTASIFQKKTSFRTFLVNRYSRLYPLHFIMLFAVLGLQMYYYHLHGSYFIYPDNGWRDLIKNLLFIQSWGGNKTSFNGPVWSVSIEMLIYLVFFLFCIAGALNKFKHIVFSFLFFACIKELNFVFMAPDIATCFYFFFAGCILINLIEKMEHHEQFLPLLTIGSLALWAVFVKTPLPHQYLYQRYAGRLDLGVLSCAVFCISGSLLFFNLRIFDKVPARIFRFFGDMTYSTYLIHFPLQLVFFLIVNPANFEVFLSTKLFLLYFAAVIVLGRLFYTFFEVPAQDWFRKKLSSNAHSTQKA